jgi:ubiquinone/menaquinone biosynthesis C-methylase UbiE
MLYLQVLRLRAFDGAFLTCLWSLFLGGLASFSVLRRTSTRASRIAKIIEFSRLKPGARRKGFVAHARMIKAVGRLASSIVSVATLRRNSTAQKLGQALPDAWRKTYEARNQSELIEAYGAWAETYDADSIGNFGYSAPEVAAKCLAELVLPTASVLDLGAGTGLVGEFLAKEGLARITALDLSADMLAVAKRKGCYHDILKMDAEALDISDDSFDAGISVGTFTPNHVGLEAMNEFVRVVRPGGIICISLRDDFVADSSNGFEAHLKALEKDDKLEQLFITPSQLYTRNVSEDITFRCWVWAVR